MRSDRLLSILLLLQSHGRMSARELSERLEVSERTIFRDIDALSSAGVPVYGERGRGGGCALLPGYQTDVSGLTAQESRALFIAAGRGAVADLGLEGDLRLALRKLLSVLPESNRPEAIQAQERVVVDQRGWFRPEDEVPCLATVQDAVWSDRKLNLRYRSSGSRESRDRVVDPYGLVAKAGTWYLVASDAGEPRLFRVSRIESASLSDSRTERPATFNLEEIWEGLRRRVEDRGDGVDVTVRVPSDLVDLLLRICAAQILIPAEVCLDPGGTERSILLLRFPAEGAARGVLLGFGARIEVLSPRSLRHDFLIVARSLVTLYADDQVAVGTDVSDEGRP